AARRAAPAAAAHRPVRPDAALPARARYLRLTPDRSDAVFRITGVEAELASTAPETPMRWIELTATPMRIDERTAYAYSLEGPFPVRAVDVALPGNH
ncbi:DUF3999 family protein, partial [Acinetobacter baumannii]